MTREEYRAAAENVICLAACMVNGETPDAERAVKMDLTQLYKAADRHMLTAITGYALEKAGIRDTAFIQAKGRAMRSEVLFDAERQEVLKKLEEAGIWYMPLKGCVLKEYYPEIGMRQMADNDILYDAYRTEDVKAIMKGLGFETELFGLGVHDTYRKNTILNFEMHRALFGMNQGEKLYAYYKDLSKRLIGDGCEKHLTAEDFYLHVMAHEYKHYSSGGTGLRSLLDTYVLLKHRPLDMDYVRAEAEKLGIADFEERNRRLSLHLFGKDRTLTQAEGEMLEYVLFSGTYGTYDHRVQNKMIKTGRSRIRYLLDRFLVPVSRKNKYYAMFESDYPVFYKYKVLLPILPFYRSAQALKRGLLMPELKAVMKAGKRKE